MHWYGRLAKRPGPTRVSAQNRTYGAQLVLERQGEAMIESRDAECIDTIHQAVRYEYRC